jgi:putative NADH-flavin reductase
MYNYEETVSQVTSSVAHVAAESHVEVSFVSPEACIKESERISMFHICTVDVSSYLSMSKSTSSIKAKGASSLPFAFGS